MNFHFDARTIIELGKELISSDEIALYELIKNSVDAGSDKVEISVKFYLMRSDIDFVTKNLKRKKMNRSNVITYLCEASKGPDDKYFSHFIRKLEECQSNDDEFLKEIQNKFRKLNRISVKDSGEGMSLSDLEIIYLRIGTKNRRKQNHNGKNNLGDKGIGRLSAMRLGDLLTIYTTKEGKTNYNYLKIDWKEFDCDEEKLVEEIKIHPRVSNRLKHDLNSSGTEIIIRDLNVDWTREKLESIVDNKIARFIDPFQPNLANEYLEIRFNGSKIRVPSIHKELLDYAHATCSATFSVANVNSISLTGEIEYKLKGQEPIELDLDTIDLVSIVRPHEIKKGKEGNAKYVEKKNDTDEIIEALKKINDFKIEIYWFNRKVVDGIENYTSTHTETKNAISKWSGGPMLYRYNVRVLPYGEPDDDWLGLDKLAFGQSGFKLNRQQVIGRISLSTPHEFLSEQTNREGLIDSFELEIFKSIILWVVHGQFRRHINDIDKIDIKQKRIENREASSIYKLESKLEHEISKLSEYDADEEYTNTINNVKKISSKLMNEYFKTQEETEKYDKQNKEDREKFVYLAGVGLITEIVFHELYRVVNYTLELMNKGDKTVSFSILKDQLKTLEKRISSFDVISTARRQKKSKFDLYGEINKIVEFHKYEKERHNFEIVIEIPEKAVEIIAVKGMFIQIIENLFSNSSYWIKQKKLIYHDDYIPRITIEYNTVESELLFSDNGPGVPASKREEIFQPFMSHKPFGMGKGLGLYIARELAQYHGWTLKMVYDEEKQPSNRRLNKFVLQMQ